MRLNGRRHVTIVSVMLLLLGGLSALMGFLAGAALGRDVDVDGSWRQLAFGPLLIVTGVAAMNAGARNSRFESRGRGLLALVLIGVSGVVYFRVVNPYTAVAIYGLLVYLSPPGRDAFRTTHFRQTARGLEPVSSGSEGAPPTA